MNKELLQKKDLEIKERQRIERELALEELEREEEKKSFTEDSFKKVEADARRAENYNVDFSESENKKVPASIRNSEYTKPNSRRDASDLLARLDNKKKEVEAEKREMADWQPSISKLG